MSNKYKAVAKLLLEQDNIDVNPRDEDDRTPLSCAVLREDVVMLELLLAQDNIDVNSKDLAGETPLLYAAKDGHDAMVKLLLAQDHIDVKSVDKDGCTPLSWAAKNGHHVVVVPLLEAGANIEERAWTRLQFLAAKSRDEALVRLLFERKPNFSTSTAGTNDDVAVLPRIRWQEMGAWLTKRKGWK